MASPPAAPMDEPRIPGGLIAEIRAGRCVTFVGAGFTGAARLPDWVSLLRELVAKPEVDPTLRAYVEGRLKKKTAHAFDEAAQVLQDALGREAFIAHLATRLAHPPRTEEMDRRLRWLQDIPFRAVLTTNFDGVMKGQTPDPEVYRSLLRHDPGWHRRLYLPRREKRKRLTVKLHGDLSKPETVVLSRLDYRRLLYSDLAYMSFLRAVLVTNTVLYLGFSFTDAYINELRSETLAILGHADYQEPVAYAVMSDVPEFAREHYRRNEGIEILAYDTREGADYSGFDQLLKSIHDLTNPAARFRGLLSQRRLLWADPRYEANLVHAEGFLHHRRADWPDGYVLDLVHKVDEALERLGTRPPAGPPYDLVLAYWGDEPEARDDREPMGVRLLREIRARDLRSPVLLFADSRTDQRTKRAQRRTALGLGALGCFYRWEDLLRAVERTLEPNAEPA